MDFRDMMESQYRELLGNYGKEQSEQTLYSVQKLSRRIIENKVSPEEIISLHKSLLVEMHPDMPDYVMHSFDVLLEVMIAFGLAYREHQILRHKQEEIRSEMEIAANVQQTLLGTKIPEIPGLDIGAISIPAKHMNGDYFHFVLDENNCVSVAIADVIGKGIPAALCMSMIKYAMDSLPEHRLGPSYILENLNNVVEQNVDPSMFITMFYGMYNPETHILSYSSAGHEPGFYYHSDSEEFTELVAKGLLLGVEKRTKYEEYKKVLKKEISPSVKTTIKDWMKNI